MSHQTLFCEWYRHTERWHRLSSPKISAHNKRCFANDIVTRIAIAHPIPLTKRDSFFDPKLNRCPTIGVKAKLLGINGTPFYPKHIKHMLQSIIIRVLSHQTLFCEWYRHTKRWLLFGPNWTVVQQIFTGLRRNLLFFWSIWCQSDAHLGSNGTPFWSKLNRCPTNLHWAET